MSSEYRAQKSGYAAETHGKVVEKYNVELAGETLVWVKSKLMDETMNTDGSIDNFREMLKDGTRLCRLLNVLSGGQEVIKSSRIKPTTMTYKMIDLLGGYIKAVKEAPFFVPDDEVFEPTDLIDGSAGNPNQVLVCLNSLRRKVKEGIKESEKNVRHFTEEQRRAGQSVIGLQMGTNKGASQKGMNMGNMRHIVD